MGRYTLLVGSNIQDIHQIHTIGFMLFASKFSNYSRRTFYHLPSNDIFVQIYFVQSEFIKSII